MPHRGAVPGRDGLIVGFRRWFQGRTRRKRAPERYWVERGERIVGYGDLEAVRSCQQRATFQVVLDLIEREGVANIADLGSNFSLFGQLLYDGGYAGRYVGIENNPHAVARGARDLSRWVDAPMLVNGNLRDLPFRDRAFELSLMKDVLEHLEDFHDAFAEAARVTDRWLVIACFLPWSDEPPHYQRHRRGFYLNRYRNQDVIGLARQLGFEVKERRTTEDTGGAPNEVVTFLRASAVN